MKKEQLQQYIGQLLNVPTIEPEITSEIPNVIGLFSVYMAGLQGKDFPLDILLEEMDIEKEIPAEFHICVAQTAILKSKKGDLRARDYLYKNVAKLAKRFKDYFLTHQL